MASSAAAVQSPPRELCRYFLSNACRYGDKCVYSHDRMNGQVNNVCRFYLQGKCTYGDRCRYDHIRPKLQPSLPAPSYQNHVLPPPPPPPALVRQQPPPLTTLSNDQSQPVSKVNTGGIPMSYASICRGNSDFVDPSIAQQQQQQTFSPPPLTFLFQSLCPYAEKDGFCEALDTGRYCPYVHGDLCDLCQMPVLHPSNEIQREQHRTECLQRHEADCEEAFAKQRSQDKKCGVCLETVWDREGDKRFGILENCEHIFCLECIRKWRASSNYEHKVVKACPECRIKSDFVTPTKYWPEHEQAKQDLIKAYKENLQQIHCKFFKRGEGLCPFGSKCFYLHVDKHGQPVQLGPPRRRQRLNARGEWENFSDVFMVSVFSHEDFGRIFDEYDFLFDDEDDESYGSELTDEDENHHTDDDEIEAHSWT